MACSAGLYLRHQPDRAHPGGVQAGWRPSSRSQLLLLLPEALDHADAGDGVVDDAGDFAGLLLRVPAGREQLVPRGERDQRSSAGPTASATSGEQRRQH